MEHKMDRFTIIEQEYEKLANFYLMRAKEGNDKRFYFYHFELNPMNPPSVLRRFTGCGAGVEYVAVNPKGDIFPVTNLTTSCHTKWVTLDKLRYSHVLIL